MVRLALLWADHLVERTVHDTIVGRAGVWRIVAIDYAGRRVLARRASVLMDVEPLSTYGLEFRVDPEPPPG